MKKVAFFMLAILVSSVLYGSQPTDPLRIEVESYLEPTIDGDLELRLTYFLATDMALNGTLTPKLPEGWTITDWGNDPEGFYSAGDEVERVLTLSYPIQNIPYFPQGLDFVYPDLAEGKELVSARVEIYFCPWDEVEVWSYFDFIHLKRNWFADRDEELSRVYVDPAIVPVSDIPENYDPQEDWEEDFRRVDIPGLAYAIPMLPIHPDSIVDTTNVVIEDSNSRYDGCGLNWRRYQGQISGSIVSPFRMDRTSNDSLLPLEGLRVELWESDVLPNVRLGYGTTNYRGEYSFNVNTCQLWEGGELEIYLVIKAKNYSKKIKGKNTWIFGSTQTVQASLRDWVYNNGNSLDVDFGTITADNGAHRAVSMCVQAWNYTNLYSGFTLDKSLAVRADLPDGSFFLPDKYCGVHITVAANVLWLTPGIGGILGIVGTSYFASDLIFNTQKPTIFLTEGAARAENTPRHEFGHLVMWQLQNKCWTDPISGSFYPHSVKKESNTRIAWTEGWADAFSMIVDAHHRDWDGESNFYGGYEYENRFPFSAINYGPASEYHIALALYDVWDGSDKFNHLLGPTPSFADANTNSSPELWLNGQTDQVSVSFQEMCDIIANGDSNAPSNQIQSIQGFYKQLLASKSCEERSLIKQVFDQNRVVGDASSFASGSGYQGFSSDDIHAVSSVNYTGGSGVLGFSYNFLHERDAEFLWTSGQDYNLATQTVNGYKFLSDNLAVKDGATLHFNRNIPMGWVVSGGAARPVQNSTMQADLCGDMELRVFQNGGVIVGDQAVSAYADVHLKSGSSLHLGGNSLTNEGELRINNHSRFYVEEGAELIIEKGAKVVLDGNDAVLEIDGDLTIMPGATFTFSGSGHLVLGNDFWGQTVSLSPTSEIKLQGSGSNDLILQIKDDCHLWCSAKPANFNIEDGLVEMGNNANILMNGAAIRLKNVDVTNMGGGLHSGILTTGQANHLIENVNFSQGHFGLRAYQIWGTGGVVVLKDCDFFNCEIGLQVHSGASSQTNCSYTNCLTGYQHELAAFNSHLYNCDFLYGNSGIIYKTGSGDLVLKNCEVNNNINGVLIDGPGTLRGKCSVIDNNSDYGVIFSNGAFLDLSDNVDDAGTQFKIRGSGSYSMYAYNAAGLNFFHGSNDFVPMVENNNRVIMGVVLGQCLQPVIMDAERNHWNTRTSDPKGDIPISGTDYFLYQADQWPAFTCIQSVNLLDPLRYQPAVLCSYGQTGGGGGGSNAIQNNPLDECPTCRVLNTASFDNTRLNDAVQTAIGQMEAYGTNANNVLALQLFDEILSSPVSNLTDEESYVVKVALDMGKKSFVDAVAKSQISLVNYGDLSLQDPGIPMVHHILDVKSNLYGAGPIQELVEMERAMIDRMAQKFTISQSQLLALQQNTPTGLEGWMDYADCYMDAEKALLSGQLDWDEFEAQVQYCAAAKADLMFASMSQIEKMSIDNPISIHLQMDIHPNPALDHCFLSLSGFEDIPEISIWDIQGKQMDISMEPIPAEYGYLRYWFSTDKLSGGMYFIQVNTPNGKITEKLIVK